MRRITIQSFRKYVVVALLLSVGLFWRLCLYVNSANEISEQYSEKQYQQFEKQYLEEVKSCMTKAGYPDSGVTMTRISYPDGTREYCVEINHKLLNNRQDRQLEITGSIRQISFPDANSRFCIRCSS